MKRWMLLAFIALLGSVSTLSSANTPLKDSEFVYARLRYHLTDDAWRVNEVPWHHDFPYGDEMFPSVLTESTNVQTSRSSHQIVDIDSRELFKYPFAYLCEPGFLELTPEDVKNLREYLDRGGFLLVDDLRTATSSRYKGGGPEDDIGHFRDEMRKVYPDRDFARLSLSDTVFHSFFDIDSLDMAAPYIFPGQDAASFYGLRDPRGNLLIPL